MLQRRINPLIWTAKLPVIRLPAPPDFLALRHPCPTTFTQPLPLDYTALHPRSPFSPLVHYTRLCLSFLSPSTFSPCRARGRYHSLQGRMEPLAGTLPWQGWITPSAHLHHSITLSHLPNSSQTFQRWEQLEAEGCLQVTSSV